MCTLSSEVGLNFVLPLKRNFTVVSCIYFSTNKYTFVLNIEYFFYKISRASLYKFQLTDFDKLLSHHDHRVANDLDAQYLKDEWEFPEVKYKDTKFKDSTVICGDSRVSMVKHYIFNINTFFIFANTCFKNFTNFCLFLFWLGFAPK